MANSPSRSKAADRPPARQEAKPVKGRAMNRLKIVAAIEQDIVSGKIAGNQRLDERELADKFGVSRTPIREALNRLVASGLVEYRPNQGMFTVAMSFSQFFQMYEVMNQLEGLCAQLCARRMTAADRAALLELSEEGSRIAASDDAESYSRHNLAFHDLLYRGSQNAVLEQQIRSLRRRLDPYRNYSFQLPNRIRESQAEHGRIAQIIHAGNADAAEREMRSHMDIRRENFSDYLMLLSRVLVQG